MTRKRIPADLEADVIFKSNRQCVVCNERGDHIHHIDENPSNSAFDNLAFLCFNCHSEASMTSPLRKKLTPAAIRKFRDHKYKAIATERENALKVFNNPIKDLSAEDLLTISKNALIIIELEKIREEYFSAYWNKRSEIIQKLTKFSDHTNFRLATDIFYFLEQIANQTRGGMPTQEASAIYSLILNYFPYSEQEDIEQVERLADQCANISFSIVYDATFYFKKHEMTMWGLSILKFLYLKGKLNSYKSLLATVLKTYKEIEQTLQRQNRNDLIESLQLVKEFKADLKKGDLSFPVLSDNLMQRIYPERNMAKKNQP